MQSFATLSQPVAELNSVDKFHQEASTKGFPTKISQLSNIGSITSVAEYLHANPSLVTEEEDSRNGLKTSHNYYEHSSSSADRKLFLQSGAFPLYATQDDQPLKVLLRVESKDGAPLSVADVSANIEKALPRIKELYSFLNSGGSLNIGDIEFVCVDHTEFSNLASCVSSKSVRERTINEGLFKEMSQQFAEEDGVNLSPASLLYQGFKSIVRQIHFSPIVAFKKTNGNGKKEKDVKTDAASIFDKNEAGQYTDPNIPSLIQRIKRSGVIPLKLESGQWTFGLEARDFNGEIRNGLSCTENILQMAQILNSTFKIGPNSTRKDLMASINVIPLSSPDFSALLDLVGEPEKRKKTLGIIDSEDGVKNFVTVLAEAQNVGASDIHLEHTANGPQVRFRVDGILQPASFTFSTRAFQLMSGALMTASGMKNDRAVAQDGTIPLPALDAEGESLFAEGVYSVNGSADKSMQYLYPPELYGLGVRASYFPTVHGSSFVFRLHRNSRVPDIGRLGLTANEEEQIRDLFALSNGIVIVTGPTGSGKSTLCYAGLMTIDRSILKVVGVEDPVESHLPGVDQQQINKARDQTFGHALKSILRQDPDVIFVGETREKEVAELAVQGSNTGHLVITTLHANGAMEAIPRMGNFEIDAIDLGSSLRGIIAQRLVRKLKLDPETNLPDERYAEKYDAASELNKLTRSNLFDSPVMLWRARSGIEEGDSAFKGRMPIVEILQMGEEHRDLLQKGSKNAGEYREKSPDFVPMVVKGLQKILAGQTSIAELREEVPPDQWVAYKDKIKALFEPITIH